VIVEITAGMTSTDAIFKRGCAIIKALVADMFEHPEASIEKSLSENKTIERLMAGFRTR
jgi:hypothetical protein